MVICIKQHLSNIWRSIQEKVKQHWGWVEKSVAYKKTCHWKRVYQNASVIYFYLERKSAALQYAPHLEASKLNKRRGHLLEEIRYSS